MKLKMLEARSACTLRKHIMVKLNWVPYDVSDTFWTISVGTPLSDKDEVLHTEQKSIQKYLFEYSTFHKAPYEGPALELLMGYKVANMVLHLNTNWSWWILEGTW
jgi:hypothetical protein